VGAYLYLFVGHICIYLWLRETCWGALSVSIIGIITLKSILMADDEIDLWDIYEMVGVFFL
jgi:hypothetical protein